VLSLSLVLVATVVTDSLDLMLTFLDRPSGLHGRAGFDALGAGTGNDLSLFESSFLMASSFRIMSSPRSAGTGWNASVSLVRSGYRLIGGRGGFGGGWLGGTWGGG